MSERNPKVVVVGSAYVDLAIKMRRDADSGPDNGRHGTIADGDGAGSQSGHRGDSLRLRGAFSQQNQQLPAGRDDKSHIRTIRSKH